MSVSDWYVGDLILLWWAVSSCLRLIFPDAALFRFLRSFRSESAANSSSSQVDNDGNDKAKESKSLSENKDEDHTYNHVFLGVCTDGSIADNSDGEARGKGGETTAKSGSKLLVSSECSVVLDAVCQFLWACCLN